MSQLGMTPLNNAATTYAYGQARALNAGGGGVATASVAVGWLGNSATNFEAVRWSTTQDLFLIQLRRGAADPTPTSGSIASVLEQKSSLGSLGVIANRGVAATDGAMGALATAADHYRCARSAGGEASQWCGFAYDLVAGNSSFGTSGTELSGTFGLARTIAPSTSIGASIGAAGLRNGLAYGGRFDAPGATFGTYFAHRPDAGFQLLAMAVASLYPELNLTRGYLNGTTLTGSQGQTHASSAGAMERVGWAFVVPGAKATVTPFAQLSYVNARVGAFVESGGPFPATISAFNAAAMTLRVGAQLRGSLTARITAFGGGRTARGVLRHVRARSEHEPESWVEGHAGLPYELAPGSAAMISANAASQNTLTYGLQVGYSRAF